MYAVPDTGFGHGGGEGRFYGMAGLPFRARYEKGGFTGGWRRWRACLPFWARYNKGGFPFGAIVTPASVEFGAEMN